MEKTFRRKVGDFLIVCAGILFAVTVALLLASVVLVKYYVAYHFISKYW